MIRKYCNMTIRYCDMNMWYGDMVIILWYDHIIWWYDYIILWYDDLRWWYGRVAHMALLCAEQDVGNLKHCTFKNSGTPVRRTRPRKSQKLHFPEFWDTCAQNKTSEISKSALSGILGLLCAEQNVGSLKQLHSQELWDSCAQDKTSEISRSALS